MPDASALIKVIKKAAVDAVEASKPVNICYGKVTNTSPLQVYVSQKMTLGESQLILTRNVTDYTVTMAAGSEQEETYTVYNGLAAGEEVILVRQQEGQKYVVFDRIG